LLDEPFAALDLTVRRELRRWLRSLHEETHVTTLLVTHDPDEAMDIADRIVLMHEGRVQQSGSPGTLYAEPATPFVMTFIGEANAIDTNGQTVYVRPHEVVLERAESASAVTGTAERIVDFGSRVQVELRLGADRIVAELSDARFRELGCTVGGTYDIAFTRTRSFARTPLGASPVKEELPA
jgi:sulfate transport system ATP-binding protein